MSTENHVVAVRRDSLGVEVRVDGAVVYWFSPAGRVAWNLAREYPLTSSQIDKLLVEASECNADVFGR